MTRVVPIPLSISWAYLLIGDGAVLVDTGSAGDEERLLQAIKAEGIEPADLRLILHTHGHSDHAGTTAMLRSLGNTPTAIHRRDETMMASGKNRPVTPMNWLGRILMLFSRPEFPACPADIVFDESFDLRPYGVAGKIVETPGHTAGSVSVLLESGECVAGDLFAGSFNFWLFATPPMDSIVAENASQMRESIAKLLVLNPTRIYLGHGNPVEAADVRRAFALKE